MRSIPFVATVILILSCVTPVAQGQALLPEPGARVRLTLPCEHGGQHMNQEDSEACRLVGRFVSLRAGTITFETNASTVSHKLSDIRRMEVSRGRRGHWLAGAGVGLIVGGIAWLVLRDTGSTGLCSSNNQDALSSGECAGLTVLAAVVCGGVGAGIGGLVRTEAWQDVPIEGLGAGLEPQTRAKLGLAMGLGF